MFNKMKAVAVAAAVAGVVVLAGATEASAINVGTLSTPIGSGSMAFSATAPSARIVVNGSNPLALNCPHAAFNGTINTGAFATTYPVAVGTGQPVFTGPPPSLDCLAPAGFLVSVTCVNTSSLVVSGPPAGGPPAVVPGAITGISCVIALTGICSATLSGTVQTTYTNPTAAPLAGKLTVLVTGQALAISASTCPPGVLANGSAQFGGTGPTPTSLTNLTYTLNGASSTHPFISL